MPPSLISALCYLLLGPCRLQAACPALLSVPCSRLTPAVPPLLLLLLARLVQVLSKHLNAGAFGPHVPAPWMRRAQMAREADLLELDRLSTPMANRPDSTMSGARSARGATPRSVRKDALDELSKNMYYTSRVSRLLSCLLAFEVECRVFSARDD